MKIEAGKFYRTRDGRKAFVAWQKKDNPFETEYKTLFPFAGYAEKVGKYEITWTVEGFVIGGETQHTLDLVAEWEDKPEFRPFDGMHEFTPHLNRWIVRRERTDVLYRPFYVENKGVRIHFSNGDPSALLSWNLLFEKYMFLGGDCCGVRNT